MPLLLTDPEQQFDFLITHYWDYFDFADTTYIPSPEITEQAWVDYIDLLRRVPVDKAQETMKAMMLKSSENSKKLFLYFTGMADKYLYEPNSPARNEDLYIPVLEVMIQTPALDDAEKMLPKYRLEWAFKNRAGTKAINFQYADIAERTGTLYQIKADYILVFFNNPGCHSCKDHIESISSSVILNKLLSENRLKILSIYPDDKVEEWKEHYTNYPAEWINGYDKLLAIESNYDLKAIPTLYLLDKDKKVLLKDATLGQIEKYLLTF
jgi:thiol-disulfide isomerase/thioredoxin